MQTPTTRSLVLMFLVATLSGHAAPDPAANAPETGNVQPEFIIHNWFVEDGLPHNGVNNIVRDARGFLWIGTSGGLARFDGRNFVEYPMPAGFAQGRYNIRALAVEDGRTMLMINAANKLIRLRDGKYELHPANAHLQNLALFNLAVDDTGAIWIGADTPASESVILRWTAGENTPGGHIETFGPDPGITRRTTAFCFVSDGSNRTWIAAGDFFGWYEDGKLHRYEKQNLRFVMITKSRSGCLWVASRDNLVHFDPARDTWDEVFSRQNWPVRLSGLQYFHESENGTLWLATRREGVLRLINGRLVPLAFRHDRGVQAITEDINGDVWLGIFGSGLVHLKPNHHVLLNTETGFPTDISSSLTVDETGALWCANQSGGVVRVANGETTVIKAPTRNMPFANSVCADQRGAIWVGTMNGMYTIPVKTPAGGTRTLTRLNPDPRNVQTLFCDSTGNLWISWANTSLGVLRDGRLTEFTADDGFPRKRVSGIVERKGARGPEIWVALESGSLFQVNQNAAPGEKKFVEKTLPPGAQNTQLHTLFTDGENRVWLGTTNGLLLWRDGEEPRLLTQDDGLPDNIINQIVADNQGRLWVSSRRGIFHVSIKQLLETADGRGRKTANATLFGRNDDLAGISGMVGRQPMAWKGGDGRIWFATYRGVVGFNPADSRGKPGPIPLHIDEVRVNGGAIALPDESPLHIGPGVTQLDLHFAALDFAAPERTRVRRMLEGFDVDWNNATSELFCTYPNLQPGRYTFRIEATNDDGGASHAETTLVIIVAAAWWQTVWFRATLALVCVALIAWIARKVSNRLLKQRLRRLEHEHALERERTRIARDLHDELGGRVTKIGCIADRLIHEDAPAPAKQLARNLITQSRYLVEDLHGIVWTVNPQNDSWQRLAAYIVRHAQRHLAGTPILCTADGAGAIPELPITPEARHNILSIAKEVLNNILKHSQATRATITMSVENEHFRMVISDDGRGFDPSAPETNEGNGLSNMRTRMAEIDGHVDITSRPGTGVTITIDSPLKCRPPHYEDGANPRSQTPDATQSRHR
jgi:signal transduction histidine kinase/ligand-binding sensor domain-containing protein